VGTGIFSFDGDLGDGSFALDTLANPVFNASFNGDTFVLADTEDNLSEVLAIITTLGPNRFLRFGNINDSSGGMINGSFDFINNTNQSVTNLSFEPGVTGGDLYGASAFFGNYVAVTPVPEPSTLLSLSIALATLAFPRRAGRGGSTVMAKFAF